MNTKQLISLLLLLGVFLQADAQLDLKLNALGFVVSKPEFSIEYGFQDEMSLEGTIGYDYAKTTFDEKDYDNALYRFRLAYKYYPVPMERTNRWGFGLYTSYSGGTATYSDSSQNLEANIQRMAAGAIGGYKWVTSPNIIIEINMGVGYVIYKSYQDSEGLDLDSSAIPLRSLDAFVGLSVGYRIEGQSKE